MPDLQSFQQQHFYPLCQVKQRSTLRINSLLSYFRVTRRYVNRCSLSKYNYTATSHVFTTVVSSAFHHCLRKRVSYSKSLSSFPSNKDLTPSGTIQAGIPYNSCILGAKSCILCWSDNQFSPRNTLAKYCFAYIRLLQAKLNESCNNFSNID